MHESTRRLLCRVAFLLGCVVPTMCTLSWITYRQSSWSVAAVEAELSDTIGLKCRIAKYYNPKPSKWVFEQVRLERAGSDAVFFPVLKAELVDETWLFSADEAEVAWNARHRLWEALQEGVLLNPTSDQAFRLTVAKISFLDGTMPSLSQLDVKHDPNSQPTLTSSVVLGDTTQNSALIANIDTSHPVHWRVQLASTEKPIPIHPWRFAFPELAGLGDEAQFLGQVSMELNHSYPYLELNGELQQIDLNTALATNNQFGSAGQATLYLTRVLIRDSNFVEARGGIRSFNGQLPRKLLDRAVEHLGVHVVPPLQQQDLVAYHEMTIGFDLKHGRLSLRGLCDGFAEGTMMAGPYQPIVFEGRNQELPATNLASVFHDNQFPMVPASQPAVDMARWLTAPMLAERPGSALR
ncbi:hypothetical protein ACYFX5_10180 [Bremerella sp. T1]|uniref:hypothetical protein n=1 Tax=Bremerella sp. TYQ1 TaxID=3119568 RepID=UPI001CCCAF4B|nr:hypothetical protein [Bremerella volcania]UBM38616.1 hypothetical protein LA756_12125 [Bremerella volcania]